MPGIEPKREPAGFEATRDALDSGRYDFGASNFAVTDERRETIDFATRINDGQGFATRKDSRPTKITDLAQPCGLNVATDAGATFEATPEENAHACPDADRKAYKMRTHNEQGANRSSLQQGRSDIAMSTINGLRYAVTRQQGVRF
ncbi:transporter substrate-binding domain-containing protein [Streptomyces sp. ADMS]|uniref:transporter substrate-binding domain-containing protein n=1 Tax=Streptomyces sp. ADMS TaxID=3071415 RepID=UPI003995D677